MPKISVIIPVYNSQKYIEECLESVLHQTLSDIEIICVDDGSTDKSTEIIQNFIKKDKRISLIKQKNLNAGIARNNGLKQANGEYIHFLDSDDVLLNNKVYENLYKIANSKNKPNILKFKNKAFEDLTNKYIQNNVYELKEINQNCINKFLNIHEDLVSILSIPVTPWSGIYKKEFLIKNNLQFNDNKCCNDRSFYITSMIIAEGCFLSEIEVINHRILEGSLVKIRDMHFDCHFKSINIIKDFLDEKSYDFKVKKLVLIRELRDLFGFYGKFIITSSRAKEIHKEMLNFIKNLDISFLQPEICDEYFYNMLIYLKNPENFDLKLKNLLERHRSAKIALWGASSFLKIFLDNNSDFYTKFIGVIDKNGKNPNLLIKNIEIYLPEEIEKIKPDYIILTIMNKHEIIYKDIRDFLQNNYPSIKLLPDIFTIDK